ncbi:MAG: hypothetical protein AAF539_02400 [Planctomycetota bacterium]
MTRDARWMATPPLRRRRVVGRGGVVLIGDAAGYVEPLTGEGMTWAIESGIAVADAWFEHRSSDTLKTQSNESFAAFWQRRRQRLLRRRMFVCDVVTRAFRYRWFRSAACGALARRPGLSRPLIWSLASGPKLPNSTALSPNRP